MLAGDTDHDNIDGSVDYQNWQSYEPGMIHVSTITDEFDSDLSFGDVSLREAVDYTNHATEPTIIDLPTGRYTLTLSGTEGTGTAENDLDITADTTIIGEDPALASSLRLWAMTQSKMSGPSRSLAPRLGSS